MRESLAQENYDKKIFSQIRVSNEVERKQQTIMFILGLLNAVGCIVAYSHKLDVVAYLFAVGFTIHAVFMLYKTFKNFNEPLLDLLNEYEKAKKDIKGAISKAVGLSKTINILIGTILITATILFFLSSF